MSVLVTKADGTTEPFVEDKLRRSLRRAGAHHDEVQEVIQAITPVLFDGIKTQEIYGKAFEHLRKIEQPSAARYSLRRALFGLGPTGFPFEDFLARLFAVEGYKTQTRLMVTGKCVEHEIDVAAYTTEDSFVAEAKFHSRPGVKSDLQVIMYSFARKLDLEGKRSCAGDQCGIQNFLVVTNTKFTHTAERYAECVGVELLSWDYPKDNNLHDRIQAAGVYPISVLSNLSNTQKRALIERGAIICRDIVDKPHLLRHAHLSAKKIEAVLSEARQLCTPD
ncbi:ATPase [bacterium]|nr:ATPase [bacterium]|tara:strand:+ start:1031 stop:1864 length:834 start_codon:yes stop_codon:yes gene_type:complete